MKTAFLVLSLALLSFGCKPEIEELPSCIDDLVLQAEKGKDDFDAWQIIEYEYDGERYYLVAAGCCDRFNPLFDRDCNEICNPSGGFSGAGDGKCPDWVATLTDGVIIWERE